MPTDIDPFADLREELRATLPTSLRDAADEAIAALTDPTKLANAITLSHRIRGTAGSLGFHDESRATAELEEALRAWPQSQNETRVRDAVAKVRGLA